VQPVTQLKHAGSVESAEHDAPLAVYGSVSPIFRGSDDIAGS